MTRLWLADYDPRWPERFEAHRRRIEAALRGHTAGVEHIGSTAVPGLAAKPVIDVLVRGAVYDGPAVRSALESAGYELAVDEPGHRMFKTPDRDAHVHLWADDSQAQRHLRFRDRLRGDPQDRALYEHVKRTLAEREWESREHYAQAKAPVIEAILRRAEGRDAADAGRVERFAKLLLERLPPRARILEIGAGEGLLSRRLAEAGHRVAALDRNLLSTFPIVESSFEDYEAPGGSFACVAAQLVLHHLHDLPAALDKAARLTAPHGFVAIDDYGWERSADAAYRQERRDLHTSEAMLAELRARFQEVFGADHAGVTDSSGAPLGFTFIGKPRAAAAAR